MIKKFISNLLICIFLFNSLPAFSIEENKEMLESNQLDILMAKFSNLAYKNIRKYKNGQKLFKNKDLSAWEYFQPDDISDEFKSKIFTAINNETKEVVIVFKGSEPLPSFDMESIVNDWCVADLNLVIGKIPKQFYDAYKYVQAVKPSIPTGFKVYMTGHSLGGSIVQLLCSLDENKQVTGYTYNAFGVKHLLPSLKNEGFILSSDFNNINNFSMSVDLVSNQNEHIGNVFVVKYEKNFAQTVSSIISELPKIMTDIPYKTKKSIIYSFNRVNWAVIKINGHLMNNFTNEFEYKEYDKNNTEEKTISRIYQNKI